MARLQEVRASGVSKPGAFPASERGESFAAGFTEAMDDDLNTSEALGALFPYLRDVNTAIDEGTLDAAGASSALDSIRRADAVLGILPAAPEVLPAEIEARIEAKRRTQAATGPRPIPSGRARRARHRPGRRAVGDALEEGVSLRDSAFPITTFTPTAAVTREGRPGTSSAALSSYLSRSG
jgi:hypothetical protein